MPLPTEASRPAGPHLKKSRTGCSVCRERRVKCDEVRPVCGNCTRRFTNPKVCQYADDSLRPRRKVRSSKLQVIAVEKVNARSAPSLPVVSEDATAPGSMSRPTLWPAGFQESGSLRLMEMRLMHHYTRVVCYEMPNCSSQQVMRTMWHDSIPRIGFSHSIVLDPLLALSAMHLHSYTPSDPQLQTLVSFYLDRTLAKYRELVPQIDGDLAEPLFLAAVMLSNITWLLSHRRARDKDGGSKLPLETYHMLRGIAMLFNRKCKALENLGYAYFEQDNRPVLSEERITTEMAEKLRLVEQDLATLLKTFRIDRLPESKRAVYQEAADFILWLYKVVLLGAVDGPIHALISTLPLQLQRRGFLELLKSHDPLAMAFLARSSALFRLVKYKWWVQGTGEYDVLRNQLETIHELLPTSCQWTVDWVHKVATEDIRGDGIWEILRAHLQHGDEAVRMGIWGLSPPGDQELANIPGNCQLPSPPDDLVLSREERQVSASTA